jgi:hypothetical protein
MGIYGVLTNPYAALSQVSLSLSLSRLAKEVIVDSGKEATPHQATDSHV